MGQFALFTYLRPFLETATHVNVSVLSSMLLLMGVASLVGTSLIGILLQKHLYCVPVAVPLVLVASAPTCHR